MHRGWDGGDIRFPDAPELVLSPAELPYLATKVGDDIVTASGTTLLGADDKAGVAIIMTAARHLLANPEHPARADPDLLHAGRGDRARRATRGCPRTLAPTSPTRSTAARVGEIVYETFSADAAVVKVKGVSIHPGQAKGKLVNALHLAAKIVDTLPQATLTPETTDGRQGFIHLYEMRGTAAEAELRFILRDFERDGLAANGALAAAGLRGGRGDRAARADHLRDHAAVPQHALLAGERHAPGGAGARRPAAGRGIEPFSSPIRGGTDGSRLTEMGVPTPNLFTGMQEIHGPLEWVSVQDMAAATKVVIRLAEIAAK